MSCNPFWIINSLVLNFERFDDKSGILLESSLPLCKKTKRTYLCSPFLTQNNNFYNKIYWIRFKSIPVPLGGDGFMYELKIKKNHSLDKDN